MVKEGVPRIRISVLTVFNLKVVRIPGGYGKAVIKKNQDHKNANARATKIRSHCAIIRASLKDSPAARAWRGDPRVLPARAVDRSHDRLNFVLRRRAFPGCHPLQHLTERRQGTSSRVPPPPTRAPQPSLFSQYLAGFPNISRRHFRDEVVVFN